MCKSVFLWKSKDVKQKGNIFCHRCRIILKYLTHSWREGKEGDKKNGRKGKESKVEWEDEKKKQEKRRKMDMHEE